MEVGDTVKKKSCKIWCLNKSEHQKRERNRQSLGNRQGVWETKMPLTKTGQWEGEGSLW